MNCMKKPGVPLNAHKKNAICKPLELSVLKKIGAHFNKSTVNDVVLGLVSVGLKSYLSDNNDNETKSLNLLIPYSLRKIPDTP